MVDMATKATVGTKVKATIAPQTMVKDIMATTTTVGTEGEATIAPQTMVKDIMAGTEGKATIAPQTMVKGATVGMEGMAIEWCSASLAVRSVLKSSKEGTFFKKTQQAR